MDTTYIIIKNRKISTTKCTPIRHFTPSFYKNHFLDSPSYSHNKCYLLYFCLNRTRSCFSRILGSVTDKRGRASCWQREGHRFEPGMLHRKKPLLRKGFFRFEAVVDEWSTNSINNCPISSYFIGKQYGKILVTMGFFMNPRRPAVIFPRVEGKMLSMELSKAGEERLSPFINGRMCGKEERYNKVFLIVKAYPR